MRNTIQVDNVGLILLILLYLIDVFPNDFSNLAYSLCSIVKFLCFLEYMYNTCLLTVALAKVSTPNNSELEPTSEGIEAMESVFTT